MAPQEPPIFGKIVSALYHFMKRVPDPRCRSRIKHGCAEVLTCLILGFCAGRTTLERALNWCDRHCRELKRHMNLPHGIPSDSTACRLLKRIDDNDFSDVFLQWATSLAPIQNTCLILDGKGLRASASKVCDERTPYVMNILDAETGLCVGLTPVGGKENEKPAFHRILDLIEIEGSLILADAMATDAKIMEHIKKREASFFFQVKKNNPETYSQLLSQMKRLSKVKQAALVGGQCDPAYARALESFTSFDTWERNRERHEYRQCQTTNDSSLLDRSRTDLPFLKTIGVVSQTRILLERNGDGENVTPSLSEFKKNGSRKRPIPLEGDEIHDDIMKVGIISDVEFNAETALAAKRQYWAIENSFHYVLDNLLHEDHCTARGSRTNRAILHRIAYNILRIVQIREDFRKEALTKVADTVCDDFSLARKYIFSSIAGFTQ